MRFLALFVRFLFVTTHRDVESRRRLLLQLACSVVLSRESADARTAGVNAVQEIDFLRICQMMSDQHRLNLFNMDPDSPTQPWFDRQIALRVEDNLKFNMNARNAFRDVIPSSSIFDGKEFEHAMDHSELDFRAQVQEAYDHAMDQVPQVREALEELLEADTVVVGDPYSHEGLIVQHSTPMETTPRAPNRKIRSDKGAEHHCSYCGEAGHKRPTCPTRLAQDVQ